MLLTSDASAREPAPAVMGRKGVGAMKAAASAGSSAARRKSRRAISSCGCYGGDWWISWCG